MVFGVLEAFDLPDCLSALAASKNLTLVQPWDSRMRAWSGRELPEHLKSLGLEGVKVQLAETAS
jgi:hypothetical protein